MKRIIFTLFLSFISLTSISHAGTILDDKDILAKMLRAKVPAKIIFAAKADQNEKTVTDLILSAAPLYP